MDSMPSGGYRASSRLGDTEKWNAELIDENKSLKLQLQNPFANLPQEKNLRAVALDKIVERGARSYIELGRALNEIKNDGLYALLGFDTWEDYCIEKRNIAKSYAYYLVSAYQISTIVESKGLPPPATEGHARELVKLLLDESKMLDAYNEFLELDDTTRTASALRGIVQGYLPPKEYRSPEMEASPEIRPHLPAVETRRPNQASGVSDDGDASPVTSPEHSPSKPETGRESGGAVTRSDGVSSAEQSNQPDPVHGRHAAANPVSPDRFEYALNCIASQEFDTLEAAVKFANHFVGPASEASGEGPQATSAVEPIPKDFHSLLSEDGGDGDVRTASESLLASDLSPSAHTPADFSAAPQGYWTLEDVMKYQGRLNGAIRSAAHYLKDPAIRVWFVSLYTFVRQTLEGENLL